MAKGCALSTGYLPRAGLPRNSVDRITDCPDMTSAVDRGRKASTQTTKRELCQRSEQLPSWLPCIYTDNAMNNEHVTYDYKLIFVGLMHSIE